MKRRATLPHHARVCLTAQGLTPPPAGCDDTALDGDQDVDQADFAIFSGYADQPDNV